MAPADVQASAAAGCDRRVESITKCPGAALVHTPEPMQRPQSTSSLQSLAMRFPPSDGFESSTGLTSYGVRTSIPRRTVDYGCPLFPGRKKVPGGRVTQGASVLKLSSRRACEKSVPSGQSRPRSHPDASAGIGSRRTPRPVGVTRNRFPLRWNHRESADSAPARAPPTRRIPDSTISSSTRHKRPPAPGGDQFHNGRWHCRRLPPSTVGPVR